MPKPAITSHVLTDALAKALHFDPSKVYRIIIDAEVGEPLKIEIYQYGTDDVVTALLALNPSIIEDQSDADSK